MSSFPINEKKLAPLSNQCTVIIHDAYCAFTFRKCCQSNRPSSRTAPLSQKVERWLWKRKESIRELRKKGCLLMENNLNDSVSILLNYQTEYSWFANHDGEDHSLKWLLQIEFTVIILYFTREDNDTTRESRDLLDTTN